MTLAMPQDASSATTPPDEGRDDDLETGNHELAKAEAAPAPDQDGEKHNEHETVEDDVTARDAHEPERTKARHGNDAGEEHIEHDLHAGEHEIADGDGLEVLKGRVGAIDEHVACVEGQRECPAA